MSADAGTALGAGTWQGHVFKPNEPIPITDARIVEIDGRVVHIPARVVQRLYPRPVVHLECSGQPPFAWQQYSVGHTLRLDEGITIEAVVASHVPGLSYKWMPTSQPQMVVSDDTAMTSADFLVMNFRWFRGDQDVNMETEDAYERISAFQLPCGPWIVELTAVSRLGDIEKRIQDSDGFAVTHTGSLFRSDGTEFKAKEAELVIRGLTLFISFLRGGRCGIAPVGYTAPNGPNAWLSLGAGHVTRGRSARCWLSGIHSGDSIPSLFDSFWQRFRSNGRDTLEYVLNWYLTAAESSYHVGIVMAQAALERLAVSIRGPRGSTRTGDFIRTAMEELGLEGITGVPCRTFQSTEVHGD